MADMAWSAWAWEPEAMGPVTVVAHQGGWDEAVFVALPMVVLAALLWLARRRAEREAGEDAEAGVPTGDPGGAPPPEPPAPGG